MLEVITKKQIDKSSVKNILVRATNWVGDVVMTLPALEVIKKYFSSSSITVLAKPWVLPLFENHPAVDQVISFNKGEGTFTGLYEMIRTVRLIRKKRFDLAILFQNAFEAAVLAFLGNVKYRVGYNTDGRGFLLTHKVIRTEEVLKVHQVDYYLGLTKAMCWMPDTPGYSEEDRSEFGPHYPRLYVAREYTEKGRSLIKSNGIDTSDFLIGLNPGAIFGGAKRWPSDRFAKIGDWAAEKWGARVLVLGSRNETDICNSLCSSMTHRALNLCGRTSLGEAMGIIGLCRFFVTNDSGLMHIAAALGVPTLAIFGPTDHVATGPRGPAARIIKHDIECAPCLKPECPRDHRCMLSIEPEEVWEEMENFRRSN